MHVKDAAHTSHLLLSGCCGQPVFLNRALDTPCLPSTTSKYAVQGLPRVRVALPPTWFCNYPRRRIAYYANCVPQKLSGAENNLDGLPDAGHTKVYTGSYLWAIHVLEEIPDNTCKNTVAASYISCLFIRQHQERVIINKYMLSMYTSCLCLRPGTLLELCCFCCVYAEHGTETKDS